MKKVYSTIEFEFTVTDISQQNNKIKKIIVLIQSRVKTIYKTSGIVKELREKLWTEAIKTTVD